MRKSWYSIKAAAEGTDAPAEVSILDYIGAWGVEARTFLSEFRAIKASNVKVYINSPGGSVFEALAIFNGMRATGKSIEVHVLGVAASAASYIAMAGDKIVMPDNTFLFIHNPINGVYGNAEDMREMADILDKIGASLTNTYAKRWKGSEEDLAAALAAETYLTAAECLEMGLCDEVTPAIMAEAAFDVEALPEQLRAVFKAADPRTPEPVVPVALAAADVAAACAAAGIEAHAGALALDATLTTREALDARVADVREIQALCRMTGREGDIKGYVHARKTLADVRAALLAAEAAEDLPIDTSPKGRKPPVPDFNPLAFWANRKITWSTK